MFNVLPAMRYRGGVELPVITDLVGHWIASEGVIESGGDVSQWQDQSGNGNHWNTNTATKPTIIASVLNGEPVISFGGLASMSQLGMVTTSNGGEMVTALRQRAIPSAANGWSSFSGAGGTRYLTDSNDRVVDSFGTSLPTGSLLHLGQLGQDEWAYYNPNMGVGTAIPQIRVNGAVIKGDQLFTNSFNSASTYYLGDGAKGSAVGAGDGWVGEIAESVIFERVLTSSERASIYEYFDAKYGLAFAGAPLKANLVAHWDNTTIQSGGDGTPLTSWVDKTGNGWDLVPLTGDPLHRVANRNGLDVVDFEVGVTRNLQLDISGGPPISGSTPGSIYVVAITDSAPGVNGSGLFNTSDASGLSNHHPWTDNKIYNQFGSTTRVSFNQNQYSTHVWHVFSGTSGPGLKNFHASSTVNDFILQQLSSASNTVDWNELTNWTFGANFAGRIAEILLYDTQHSLNEIEAVHRTLKAKWGI